jgi:hypothetical protein
VAIKLIPWLGKHVNMAGCVTLVKLVLTSIAINFIIMLGIPIGVLNKIDIIRRAFLWAACDKVTEGNAK